MKRMIAAGSDYPLLKMLLPQLAKARSTLQRIEIQQTMLRAGVSVMQNGPVQVGFFRDPASGTAFTYVPTPAGFQLRSALWYQGSPLTMDFARRGP